MKKIKLNNSGVVIPHNQNINTTPRKEVQKEKPVEQTKITAEFVREIKNELIRELGLLFQNIKVENHYGSAGSTQAPSKHKADTMFEPITIDSSVVVTEVSVGNIEKGFSELTETQTAQDEKVKTSINKLRSLKRGN